MGLSLKVLGEFAIRDENGTELSLPTRKTRGLLGYLAVNADKPQQRDRLMALLWSDFGEKQARHNLNQTLLSIRKLENEPGITLLEGDGERVTLRSAVMDIDIVRFRALLADDPAQAAALCEGPFLDGLAVPDPAFEEWLTATRSEFHNLVCDALERAAVVASGDGDAPQAIKLARRLVALDPLREDGHRRLMQLLKETGDRAGALRQYQTCADILTKDLQVEPDATSKALFEEIRRDELSSDAPRTPPPASGTPLAETHPSLPDKPSIAVLPFQSIAGNPDQDYLADGVVEAITAGLSRIRSFFVIARNSALTFKSRVANAVDIGKELGVAYLLEGSVQRAGDRIRITVQLVETEAGVNIWAEHYDGTIEEVFDLQDRITEQVAGQLQPSIRQAEIERSRRKRPQDQSAYDFTMRAMRHVWALESEESEKALDLLDKALAIDPNYPLALSLAGWCHAQRSVYNWSDDNASSQAQAQKLTERAAELSGDDPMILTVLGTVHTIVRNFGTARVLLERAVTLGPNAAWAWQRLGWLETYSDRPDNALEHFERALRLSPLDPMNFNIYVGMGTANEVAQKYDEAAAHYRRALEERPRAVWIYRPLASSLSGAGRMEEAKQVYDELMRNYPNLTVAKLREAMVLSDTTLDRMVTNLKFLGLPD